MRPAEKEDLPELLRMARQFVKSIDREIDREVFVEALENMIEDENAFLAITDGGMAAGMLYPSFLDGQVTAQALWWWVDPDKRQEGIGKKLLNGFEAWAMAHGATVILLTSTHALKPRIVGKIYEDRGYAPLDHVYARYLRK